MIRATLVWLSALWLGVLIHVDWHLGRPGPSHLSFGLPYHWILAILAFAPLPWLLRRRWPNSLTQASVLVIALGVVLGQGLEPLGEAILFAHGAEPFSNAVRWRIFAEFLAAGILTYLVNAFIAGRRRDLSELRARSLPAFLVLFPLQWVASCGDDSAGVEAVAPVTITVTPGSLVLTIGASAQLEAAVQDPDGRVLPGRAVQWSSSAPEIVSVSQTGMATALAVGRATIGAYSEQSVGFARVVVPLDFRIPVSSTRRWLVVTEVGSLAPECVGNEGGLRIDGSRDCSHAELSRYSLDLADPDQWTGAAPGTPPPEVVAAADGTITDICIQPPGEVTCGANGPFVLIEHDGGFSTVYAHLDPRSVSLRRKTPVHGGQRLGTMGAYGAFPAPWVHFELRHENKGSMAASVLERVQVSGRRMRDYRAGDRPDFLHAQRSRALRF